MLPVILFLIGVAALIFSWRVRFAVAYLLRRLLRTMNGNSGRRRIVWG